MVDNTRLPSNVEKGAVGGGGYNSTILIADSGDEQRIARWDIARGQWDIGYGIRNKTDLSVVIALHRACLGRMYAFLFKDWSDFELVDEKIGIGAGAITTFPITKTYSSRSPSNSVVRSYVRYIVYPVASTISVTAGGSPVSSGDYNVGDGVIEFDSAPTGDIVVNCEFDVPVRFDVDRLNVSMQLATVGQINGVKIIEVLE